MVKTRAMATREQEILAQQGIPSSEEIERLRNCFRSAEGIKKASRVERDREHLTFRRKITPGMAKRFFELRHNLQLSYQ